MSPRLPLVVAASAACLLSHAQEKPAAPPPDFTGELQLVRYDQPRAFSDGYAPTHQLAKRKDGPDAIDWPDLTFNGRPAFRNAPVEKVPLRLRKGDEARSPFQVPEDEVVQPGNHWFRPIAWLATRKHLYTADPTARCSATGIDASGRYELWLFPLRIEGEGAPQVKNVVLKAGGTVIYQKEGPWRSLTLLLPANDPNYPYELTIDGRGPLKCNLGLAPAKLGNPVERINPLDLRLPGEGPKVRVFAPGKTSDFPATAEWLADVAAAPKYTLPAKPKAPGLGIRDVYSPLTLYAAAVPHGQSGGFWKKGTKAEDYAKQIGDLGFDSIFEPVASLPSPADAESLENRAAALAREGVRLGLQYDQNWTRPSLQHPNLAFFAHTLPDWHQPLYRSLQLAAQRFNRVSGFAGFMIGGADAGYASLAPREAPNPDRPWGEAMLAFMGTAHPAIPRAISLGPKELPFEQPSRPQVDFTRYVERYDNAFRQYGYFAEAVRDVNPGLTFTTASFGSSAAAGGRGGWPWATVPGRVMFEGLKVQQAYDAGSTHSSKPMHLVALLDRLRSYQPNTATWALVDNYKLFFGREAQQRACALALTRGIRGLGTDFIPTASNENGRPELVAAQQELNTWVDRFGATYAATEPEPVIGVFYGALQAVQRRADTRANAPLEDLYRGSHEGKVTEALWLCHAAGWPARVITHQEILRGPLPASMKVILLVGLDNPDPTWLWSRGLDTMLQQFVARGGRILVDDESVCPVPATRTGLRVASYITQSELDATPELLARNQDNIRILRQALDGIEAPVASSSDPTAWAIPTRVKDTLYVTAVNWAYAEGDDAKEFVRQPDPRANKPEIWKTKANASLYVKPRMATLAWHTDRPIYDLRRGTRVTPEEAAQVDFTKDGFQWFALPPAEIASVALTSAEPGRVQVEVRSAQGNEMRGIPLELSAFKDDLAVAKISAVSGETVSLPWPLLSRGVNRVSAVELLSNQTGAAIAVAAPQPRPQAPDAPLKKFLGRKQVPLVIALTPAQEKDAALVDVAKQMVTRFEQSGRKVRLGKVAPEGVVTGLQPLRSPNRFPQWKTSSTDLVLFGTPQDNVLIMDQARGEIMPRGFDLPPAGQATPVVTKSPFVGEYDVLNVVTRDTAGAQAWLAGWK